jgi:hypothetical protein
MTRSAALATERFMMARHFIQGWRSASTLAIATLMLGGCGTPPPADSPRSEASSGGKGHEDQPEVTLTEAVRRCKAIQESNEVPVLCTAEHIEGIPTMAVAFRNEREAKELIPVIESAILTPFCDAASSSNRRAQLVETIGKELGRKLDCEMRTWSEWHSLSSPLDKGLKLCGDIQNSRDIPMSCATDVIEGVPVLSFAFVNQRAADEYQEAANHYIAAPFCESANAARLDAAVIQQVGNKMRGLACSEGKWTPWKTKPKGQPPSANGSTRQKATAVVWR